MLADDILKTEHDTEVFMNGFALGSSNGTNKKSIIQPLSVASNGTYEVPKGVDGFNPVTVNVPIAELNQTISNNGIYTFSAKDYNADGFDPVKINVAIGKYNLDIVDLIKKLPVIYKWDIPDGWDIRLQFDENVEFPGFNTPTYAYARDRRPMLDYISYEKPYFCTLWHNGNYVLTSNYYSMGGTDYYHKTYGYKRRSLKNHSFSFDTSTARIEFIGSWTPFFIGIDGKYISSDTYYSQDGSVSSNTDTERDLYIQIDALDSSTQVHFTELDWSGVNSAVDSIVNACYKAANQ